jgi:hypothetical protein
VNSATEGQKDSPQLATTSHASTSKKATHKTDRMIPFLLDGRGGDPFWLLGQRTYMERMGTPWHLPKSPRRSLTGAVIAGQPWCMTVRSIAAAAATLAVLCGCAPPAEPTNDPSASPTTTAASSIPFSLFTHCGIYEIQVQHTFFVADQPLDDGHGNPPAGWANPYQPGTISVAGFTAVFHDDTGHAVTFHERPGATSFLRTCS